MAGNKFPRQSQGNRKDSGEQCIKQSSFLVFGFSKARPGGLEHDGHGCIWVRGLRESSPVWKIDWGCLSSPVQVPAVQGHFKPRQSAPPVTLQSL